MTSGTDMLRPAAEGPASPAMQLGGGPQAAATVALPPRRRASAADYLALARLDHSTKHVFILPGVFLALVLRPPVAHQSFESFLIVLAAGFASAILIASANYVINEWLDREFDAFHPSKAGRAAVNAAMSPAAVYAEYFVLAGGGLLIAHRLGGLFFAVAVLFVLSGLVYNVRPVRSKDKPYIDVLTESFNNPIRLSLGWAMVEPGALPPASLVVGYWMGGAFLMSAKRLSEFRDIAAGPGVELLHRYRPSFRHYTEEKLTISCFLYATLAAFFIGFFLAKYRVEYLLSLPAFGALFTIYFSMSLRQDSAAQRPEKLFRARGLMLVVGITVSLLLVLTLVDLPFLHKFSLPHYVEFGRPAK